MTVNQILSRKGNAIYSVVSTITVYEAIKTMGEKNIGAILVIEDGILKGIMSERDYARKIVLKGKASKDTLVKEIMEEKVITVKPTDNLDYCMELMTIRRVRHLPVMDENLVLGIISIGDVVMAIIEVQKNTIAHLDSYISGSKA
ncbi:CBS domain-containing protein [Flavobacterium acetivorans]|uniref:CBS domain-containing protein n=1 Tax=Flavobacterium acetivorans TaxID=2893883 RepID=UPI001E5E3894|nr:CBS domain-containing protein [Flavobacterium sp. F-29]UFH36634.1 CBS domain-containing protein [Flavobacterium sp. F-29]